MDNVRTETSDICICRYDLGDEGGATLFVCAYEADWGADLPDVPNTYFDQPAWPEFMSVEQLDDFIAKLQAQRQWLAEPDPAAREEL